MCVFVFGMNALRAAGGISVFMRSVNKDRERETKARAMVLATAHQHGKRPGKPASRMTAASRAVWQATWQGDSSCI